MLNAMRKRAGSWVVKALLLLLVLSFAIWGIGDVFYGSVRNPAVATVGESEISTLELAESFNRSLTNLQRRLGTTIDRDQAIQLGLMQQALQSLIGGRLLDLRARDMGLTVDDDTLRAMIVEDPVFQSAGQFDRARFEQLLLASGMTEEGYLQSLRQDVVRRTLTSSLTAPVAVPPTLVDALYRFRNEARRGRLVTIRADSITEVPEPSEDDLAAYHEANQQRFTAPEYRRLSYVTLEAEDLIDEVAITEEQIETEYQSRIESYRTPERRTVDQLLAGEQATIEAAERQLAEGVAMAEAADALGDDGLRFESLGEVKKGDLPADFERAIFDLAEGEISKPVQSPFGWHIFRVSAIAPETVVPLAEVRDELARELALAEVQDRLPTFAAQLDDELAAGVSLAEAAATLGLEVETVAAVDLQGRDPEGKRPEALPSWPEFLQVAFETPAGEMSLLEETDAGSYFVVQVDEITPTRIKPLEEVRDAVLEGWRAERRRELARARAEELLARLEDGTSLDQIAADGDLPVAQIEPVKRSDSGAEQGINRAVVRALFATDPGTFADEPVEVEDGFALVATDEVIAADPATDPEGVAELRAELAADLQADLVAQFEAQLRRDYPVEIHGAAINRLIEGDGFAPVGAAPIRPPAPGLF